MPSIVPTSTPVRWLMSVSSRPVRTEGNERVVTFRYFKIAVHHAGPLTLDPDLA